jgi:hypothetical protein
LVEWLVLFNCVAAVVQSITLQLTQREMNHPEIPVSCRFLLFMQCCMSSSVTLLPLRGVVMQ